MKKLFEEIKIEVWFWIGILVSLIMFRTEFHIATLSLKEMLQSKKMLKGIMRARLHSKTAEEYFENVKKELPEMAEDIDDFIEMQNEMLKDPEMAELMRQLNEQFRKDS